MGKKKKRKQPKYVSQEMSEAAAAAGVTVGATDLPQFTPEDDTKIKSPVELALDFLAGHKNQKLVRSKLNGMTLSKLTQTFAQQGHLAKGRDAEVMEVAAKLGWDNPSA